MTAQSLYNQLVQGTINKDKFLYEVRRDPSLTMITRFNSFADTIQILKKKSIISENKELSNKYKADKNPLLPEVESFTIDMVSPYEYSKGINYELEICDLSVGNNLPNEDSMLKAQKKVLKNLTTEPYYYTKKMMSDVEKKQEKENQRPEEVTKQTLDAIGKGKKNVIRENVDFDDEEESPYTNCGCDELDLDNMSPQTQKIVQQIIEELGFTEEDMQDSDVMEEIENELKRRSELNEDMIPSVGKTITLRALTKLASLAGDHLPDAKDALNDLGVEYGEQIPLDSVKGVLSNYDLSISDLTHPIDEAVVLKDKAGNITYAKDNTEATSLSNAARMKGVQLTKSNI